MRLVHSRTGLLGSIVLFEQAYIMPSSALLGKTTFPEPVGSSAVLLECLAFSVALSESPTRSPRPVTHAEDPGGKKMLLV